MGNLLQDIRYSIRVLLKKPSFTIVAVVTLALGIGANTAIFSIVNAVLLKPLPYPHSEQLVQAYWQSGIGEGESLESDQVKYLKEHSRSFEQIAAYASSSSTGTGFNFTGGTEPRFVPGMRISANFFRTLGVSPSKGRDILAEEDCPGGACVAIISDRLWKSDFAADMAAMGKSVRVNDAECTMIGIMAADFKFQEPVDVFIPLAFKANSFDEENTDMMARLKNGVTFQQAQQEVVSVGSQYQQEHPPRKGARPRELHLESYQQLITGDVHKTLWLLFGAVGFVLLIACANVANLLLARAANRRGEMAVRMALGAGRWRLIRQLMTENILLALAGSAVGLLLAQWTVPVLIGLTPAKLPRANDIGLDVQALLFAIFASLLTSVLFGLVPAIQASNLDVNSTLKANGGRTSAGKLSSRVRGILIITEVALSLVLLIGATLLIKSFVRLRGVELGFDPTNVTTMQVSLNSDKYATTARMWELEHSVAERLSGLPGVVAVGTVPSLPMERGLRTGMSIQGSHGVEGISVQYRAINPDYFRGVGIRVVRGRAFNDADMQSPAPVVIVNETLARRFWSDEDPIGKRLSPGNNSRQILGVVSDIKEMGADQATLPTVYVPTSQVGNGTAAATNRWFLTSWIIRTAEPIKNEDAFRQALKEIDPDLPVARIRPMTEVVSGTITEQRFTATMMTAFAALAMLLTVVALYGVLSYQVNQRTQEIGVRLALGAQSTDVLKMVIKQGLVLTVIGVTVGLLSALLLEKFLSSLLFGVGATDLSTFALTPMLLIAVSMVACLIPALKATRVDPMVALRYD